MTSARRSGVGVGNRRRGMSPFASSTPWVRTSERGRSRGVVVGKPFLDPSKPSVEAADMRPELRWLATSLRPAFEGEHEI
jgi:hypothetical protein